MQADFFENQLNKILPSFESKGAKRQTFGRDELQNHTNESTNEGKGKEGGGRKEERRKKLLAEKNCWTQRVHLVVTFSKIRLDVHVYTIPEQGSSAQCTQIMRPNVPG